MTMNRRALLVGINDYDYLQPLNWCRDDALAMREVLALHANAEPNFHCRLLLSTPDSSTTVYTADTPSTVEHGRVSLAKLSSAIEELLDFDGDVAFYFSGHGIVTDQCHYLATQDSTRNCPGLLMNDLIKMTRTSKAREITLIIDACYSGATGEPDTSGDISQLYLRPGVTLLAASGPNQPAIEVDGHGMFTRLVRGALKGGAADVRGRVSAAAIYAYVEEALGPWDQRPIYKSNATNLSPIRHCKPDLSDEDLRRLPEFFPTEDFQYRLDPTYEVTRQEALPEHIDIFNLFKRYQVARLLRPSLDEHLYFAAINSRPAELTPLGQFYRQLAKDNLVGGTPAFSTPKRPEMFMPDPESVAKLFHETYERLAPVFNYETRERTRVPWDQVPEQNKRLMIATAADVLATLYSQGSPTTPTSQATAPSAPPPERPAE
ncbi:MAG TPA: caspase family protein [Ktedonobacterales bacterium]